MSISPVLAKLERTVRAIPTQRIFSSFHFGTFPSFTSLFSRALLGVLLILCFSFLLVFLPHFAHADPLGWGPSIENTYSLCTDGLDNDGDLLIDQQDDSCMGIVTGYVKDEYNTLAPFVSVYFLLGSQTQTVLTNQQGYYEIMLTPGTYVMFATDGTLRSEDVRKSIDYYTLHSINFTLKTYAHLCNPDCTLKNAVRPTCNLNCLGINGCMNPPKPSGGFYDVLSLCGSATTPVPKGIFIDYNQTHRVQCCNNPPIRSNPISISVNSLPLLNPGLSNMYQSERIVLVHGSTAKMAVLTYTKE
ncbi:MAG: hypothetical protein QW594_00905 [Candidatus Woesearchaeota archaeon]